MNKTSKIGITGGSGMVGKTLTNSLIQKGYTNVIALSSKDLNLKSQVGTLSHFKDQQFDYLFHLAAKVGGIAANIQSPGEFLYDNLIITCNVLEAARQSGVKKLLNLGSSCIYPKDCEQPMKEEFLLTGKLEPTNEGYAIGKIAALKMCEYYNKQYGTNFISLMPCNLYGPYDHFNSEQSHVISALMSKFHNAKINGDSSVEVWGTGIARREFLFTEDLADAMIYFMENHDANMLSPFINVGLGEDVSIRELAELIKEVVGYNGTLKFDATKPDGMLKKLLDVKRAKQLGWNAKTSLKEGLTKTYDWYCSQ